MRARRGETTIVICVERNAGSWYTSDLPPPVGRTSRVDEPCRMRLIAASWPGLNACSLKIAA